MQKPKFQNNHKKSHFKKDYKFSLFRKCQVSGFIKKLQYVEIKNTANCWKLRKLQYLEHSPAGNCESCKMWKSKILQIAENWESCNIWPIRSLRPYYGNIQKLQNFWFPDFATFLISSCAMFQILQLFNTPNASYFS